MTACVCTSTKAISYWCRRWKPNPGTSTSRGQFYCASEQLLPQLRAGFDIWVLCWVQLQSVVVTGGAAELQASQYVTAKLRQAFCLYEDTMDPVSAV